jgi:transposase
VLNSVNTKHTRRLLRDLYHRKGPGRKPLNPMAMLKAQLLKHLLRIPSDRRLALRLKHDRTAAKACGFKKQTPSHGLFTHFRHRLGEETYNRIFNQLLRGLLEDGGVKGTVIAVDSTHVDAYSQRASDNRTGKSRPRSTRRQRQTRLHPRIPGAHRMLRRVGDAPRLHRGPVIRERQGLFQATAGKGALPGR